VTSPPTRSDAASESPPDADEGAPRRTIGPYRVIGRLGGGGMGVVYEGVTADGTRAAVKVLRPAVASEEAGRRFSREAATRIEHPNVVRVLDAGEEPGGAPWIAFERLEGATLDAVIAARRVTLPEAVRIVLEAARGLAAAHARGIVHRDVKPSNLFLTREGHVKVLDFGIARMLERETRVTLTGTVVGTPSYVSPEQAQGDPRLDARTDVWSLGVVLYELIAGRAPFDRDTALATMLAVLMDQPPPLSLVVTGVPEALSAVVERCLAKRREDRVPSATALCEALEAIDLEAAASAPPASLAATHLAIEAVPARSIAPGEERLVVIVLAREARDRSAVERAIAGQGGVVLATGSPRTSLGLFGGERWEGDEVERAARAALEARRAAASVAVASGRASYGGPIGIAGAVLKAAEAGCALSLPGVALDAESARALTGAGVGSMRAVDQGLVELIDDSRASRPSVTPSTPAAPMLGRELELGQLRLTFAAARDERRATAALVIGPPGIGKSRLVTELRRAVAEEPDTTVLLGRADPMRREAAFSLLASVVQARARVGAETRGWPRLGGAASERERQEAVRAVARDAFGADEAAGDTAEFLGALVGVGLPESEALGAARRDPQLMMDRLRLAWLDWLAAYARSGPVLLVLEDLQWADRASLDVLEDAANELAGESFCVVGSGRPEVLERGMPLASLDPLIVEPRPLAAGLVHALARRVAGHDLPPRLLAALVERTAGNPLFVEQMVAALRDEGRDMEGDADLPLPMTVEAAVQSRLDHLPVQEKELCKRAAVFGRAFSAREVEALGLSRADLLLASLARRDLIVRRARTRSADGRDHQFRSRLVADVAYRMTAEPMRVELHRRAAAYLATLPDADTEEVARHRELGGEREEAARLYAHVAVARARLGDADTVVRCAEKARALGVGTELRFEVDLARAEAHELRAEAEAQRAALEDARASARTEGQRARVLSDLAVWRWRKGEVEEALRLATEAVDAARRSKEPDALVMARGRQGALLAYAGDLERAREAVREAERLADREVPALRSLAANWRAQLAGVAGDLGDRRDAYLRAIELYGADGDLRRVAGVSMNLADVSNRVGAYAEAEARLSDALEKCRRVGYRLMEGYALANLGYARTMLGRIPEALAAFDEAEALTAGGRESRLQVWIRGYRARALLRGGRTQDALREARETAMLAEASDARSVAVLAHTTAAEACLALGSVDAAVAASSRALELRDALGGVEEDEAEVFLVTSRALEAAGRVEEAADVRLRGQSRLRYIARRIADPELRERFLNEVEANRALLADA
jgi:tetratricopeptide (TPR) repeat protein